MSSNLEKNTEQIKRLLREVCGQQFWERPAWVNPRGQRSFHATFGGVPVVVAVDSLASIAACVVAVEARDREVVAGWVNEKNAHASGATWIVTSSGCVTLRSAPINASRAGVEDVERIMRAAALGWDEFLSLRIVTQARRPVVPARLHATI